MSYSIISIYYLDLGDEVLVQVCVFIKFAHTDFVVFTHVFYVHSKRKIQHYYLHQPPTAVALVEQLTKVTINFMNAIAILRAVKVVILQTYSTDGLS